MTGEKEFIGTATMAEDGTIRLFLRAEGPNGIVGHSKIDYERSNPKYDKVLEHLGGLEIGEKKPVPPWP